MLTKSMKSIEIAIFLGHYQFRWQVNINRVNWNGSDGANGGLNGVKNLSNGELMLTKSMKSIDQINFVQCSFKILTIMDYFNKFTSIKFIEMVQIEPMES